MSRELTHDSSFARRLWAYVGERFPLVGNGLLIVAYFSSNQFLAKVLTAPGEPMRYSIYSLTGAVTLLCVFFHLRVFDEHKDYAEDRLHYPERILSRGLVTLRQLAILGAVALGLEIALAAHRGWETLVAVVAVIGFSLLMLKEFFVGEWLKEHFLVYASSHMLIMPLLALLVFSFTTGRPPWEAPPLYWLYSWVGFFVTFNWEVSRKIRAPEQEIDGVDSYTKIFGLYGAAWVVLAIRVVDTLLVALVGWFLGVSAWFYWALVVLFAVCLIGFFDFRFRTSPASAKRMETYAGLYVVAFDLILAVEIIRMYGLEL